MGRYRSGFRLATPFRCLGISLVVLLLAQYSLSQPIASVFAQDDSTSSAEESLEEAPASGGPSTAPRSRATDGEEIPEQTLMWLLRASGVFGFFIVICSLVSVAFIVEHSLTIRRGKLMPEEAVTEIDELVQNGRIEDAIEACRNPENVSLFTNVVLAGLERFRSSEFGFAEFRAAAEEAGEEQTTRLYRKTEVLQVIGTIAPMLGLLGTVSGMIKSFSVISSTKGMARPYQLASGIAEALVTTYMGLVVAIPTMIAFSFFRNKIDSLVAEAGKKAEQVLMPLGRRRM